MNKELEELKKEFEEKFGEYPYYLEKITKSHVYDDDEKEDVTDEIWNFFEPHLSHDEIKRKAVESIKEEVKGMKTGHSSYSCKPNICVCGADEDRWNLAIDEVLTYLSQQSLDGGDGE